MPHVFFTSYARLDNNAHSPLRDVIAELQEGVRGLLGAPVKDIGFVDATDILTGDEWQVRLGDAVNQARVLVCMLSPTYFNSEWCAKEFAIFRRRLEMLGAQANRPRIVVPVLWEARSIPETVSRFQFKDERLPARYIKDGLRALKRVRSQRDAYRRTIDALAGIICDAAATLVPPLSPMISFGDLPRAFDNPGRYNVALMVLHPRGPQWSIGIAGSTVGRIVDSVASSLKVPWRDMPTDIDLRGQLDAAAAERAVVVVITDAESATKEPFATMFAHLDASAPAPLAVLIGAPTVTPDDAFIRTLLPTLLAKGGHYLEPFSLLAPESLHAKLAQVVTKLRLALVDSDPVEKIDDLALRDAANRDCIPIATRPSLNGPGGAL